MMNKNLSKVIIKSDYTRKYPDPLNRDVSGDPYNIEHHILVSKAIDIPSGISKEPNPRDQRVDYGIYKKVRDSLEDTGDLSFHLKNKGITIFAHKVEYSADKRVATLYLGQDDGIADGGHTYEIILKAQSNGTCPEEQYVKLEVITGVPGDLAVDITGGLNTAVQVQEGSLLNLENRFEWVKETLKDMPYAECIAYKQNEKQNEKMPYDIRDILSFMTLFNVNNYTPTKHPKEAYVSKAQCLDLYNKDQVSYEMLKPILKDILYLHDFIHIKGRKLYNEANGGKAGAMTGVYKGRKRGKFYFVFMDKEEDYRLHEGALYPIFGAMRFLVEQKPGEDCYSWKLNSFEEVKSFFCAVAPQLIATTYNTSIQYGRKPNPIGKDVNHWDNLYKTVALHHLTPSSC